MADNQVSIATLKPSVTAEDWVQEAKLFGEMFGWAQVGESEGNSFVYLLSAKWIDAWKEKVSYSVVEEGMSLGPEHIKEEVELPPLNADLVDQEFKQETREYEFLKSDNPNYSLFSSVVRSDVTEFIDYLLIKEDAWNILKSKYPQAVELKRVKVCDPYTGLSSVEVKFPMVQTYIIPKSQFKFVNNPEKFNLKQYRFQISKFMTVEELKTLLLEYVQRKVEEKLLPAALSEKNLGLFLLKPDTSMDEVVDLLKKVFKTEYSFVQEVKIPAVFISKNSKVMREYDISLEGSVFVVETQTHFKLLLKGEIEDDDDEERGNSNSMDTETTKEKTRILQYPERTQMSVLGNVGLRNIGNTCFMNSALQCLSHTIELTDYFLNKYHQADINATNTMGTRGLLAEAYASLLFEMWNGTKQIFDNYNQHDSQEFLSSLLDGLNEDLNLIEKKPYVEKTEINDAKPTEDQIHQLSRRCWIDFLRRNYSKVVKMFFAQYKSTVKCPICHKVSTTFDPYQLISLSIPALTCDFFSAFFIAPNYSTGADKYTFEIKYEKQKGEEHIPKVGDCLNELGRVRGVDPSMLKFYTFGFSVYGEPIQNNSTVPSLMDILNNPSYKPRLFITQLTEEEKVKLLDPACISVFGLVTKGHEFPGFNKVVYMLPTDSSMMLYFEIYKKFAHFYRAEYEQKVFDGVKSDVNYLEGFKQYYLNQPEHNRAFALKYEGVEIAMSEETRLSSIFKPEDLDNPDRLVKLEIELSPDVDDHIFVAKMKSTNIVDDFVKVGSESQQNEKIDIKYLLRKLSEPEIVDEDNKFYCSQCKDHVRIEKTLEIYNAPSHLLLHMKKLKLGNHNRKEKPILDIGFDIDGLDMTDFVASRTTVDAHCINKEEFCSAENSKFDRIDTLTDKELQEKPPQRLIYDLYGVINHSGSNYGGHYTAYARTGDEWHYYDDSSVTLVKDRQDIVGQRAYVLFYRLRK